MRSANKISSYIQLFLLFLVLFKVAAGQKEVVVSKTETSNGYPPNANFTKIARYFGYNTEEYTIVTDDGYILSLFRIPKGRNCEGQVRKPPVLLMHGLTQSSDSWLDAGPSASLAFLISDACYDLWLANVRGNYYGRKHVRLNPDTDAKFWQFTTHEMACLDLPPTIDVMLNTTGSDEIIFVGYSEGGRLFYILCSETEYCNKIKFSISIAPAARVKFTRSLLLQTLCKLYVFLEPFLKSPHEMEVYQRGGPIEKIGSYLCKDSLLSDTVCKFILSAIDSYDPGSLAIQTLRVMFEHAPAGTSARNLAFYGQGKLSGRFQKYDHGPLKNLEIYGSVNPPPYNLSRVNLPVLLIYGNNDFVIDPRDIKWLARQLPNVVECYKVARSAWNHLDMCYSQYIGQLVFPKIKEYLEKYSKDGAP